MTSAVASDRRAVVDGDPFWEASRSTDGTLHERRRREITTLLAGCLEMRTDDGRLTPRNRLCEMHLECFEPSVQECVSRNQSSQSSRSSGGDSQMSRRRSVGGRSNHNIEARTAADHTRSTDIWSDQRIHLSHLTPLGRYK